MDAQTYWEKIYGTSAADAVSWYRPQLEKSLGLIEHAVSGHSASIIDVGGGESTLVDDLVARGYRNITVLDISTKNRLGSASEGIRWLIGDITSMELERVPTMCGMTAPCFISLQPPTNAQLMSAKWPRR